MVRKHAFAWGYLTAFATVQLVYALLSPHARLVLLAWASTNRVCTPDAMGAIKEQVVGNV